MKKTREVKIGGVTIGGGNRIAVQSMTNNQFVVVQNLLVLAPVVQILKAVHTADEDKTAIRVLLG